MPSAVSQCRRTQSKLLISKLLDSRDSASPLTLIIDSLEQTARPVWQEYVRRSKVSKTKTTLLSYETLRKPKGVDFLIPAYSLEPSKVQQELKTLSSNTSTRNLIIIDSLHSLLSNSTVNVSSFLTSLVTPLTSLVVVYHSDQPATSQSAYQPHPLTLLKFLATTILTTHSLSHVLARKAARDRSIAAPVYGVIEAEEGAVQGLGANDSRGTVVECETRRKSGRSTEIWFVLPGRRDSKSASMRQPTRGLPHEDIVLLEDHPLYRDTAAEDTAPKQDDEYEVSFNLGLTEKQRRARENVDLPYFDAQREGGGGEGGRILYDMGVEDDFDEEEDEI